MSIGESIRTGADRPAPHPAATAAVAAADQGAVSWAAILAGAAAAAALSLVLVILGVGLGLSSVSPWAFEGVSAETFGWSTIAWLTGTSIAASGMGGYLAGRLRTRWSGVQPDESFFRDTAHGFLAWAVATLITAIALTSAVGTILGTGIKAGASVTSVATGALASAAGGIAATDEADGGGSSLDYWVDSLFRSRTAPVAPAQPAPVAEPDDDQTGTAGSTQPAVPQPQAAPDSGRSATSRTEVARIFIHGLGSDSLDSDDADHVARLIAAETGLSESEARSRIDDIHARFRRGIEDAETTAREMADEARQASAYAALWLFITLLMGAFFASLLATFGGRQRDA